MGALVQFDIECLEDVVDVLVQTAEYLYREVVDSALLVLLSYLLNAVWREHTMLLVLNNVILVQFSPLHQSFQLRRMFDLVEIQKEQEKA